MTTRYRLAEERGQKRWTMFRAIAGLAAAALLAACGGGEGTLTPAAVTPRPSVVAAAATASPAATAPLATTGSPAAAASATARPSAPAAGPSAAPATAPPTAASERPAACVTSAQGAILGEQALITDVRVGAHEGYDRIVFEFASRHAPAAGGSTYVIAPATPPYLQDGSGLALSVAGDAVLKVTLRGATTASLDGSPAYSGSRDIVPGFSILRELKGAGDFEAVSSWFVGVNGPPCAAVAMLAGPARLVIDLRHP
ncbi:MAG: hypothetical protein ABR525_01535 [Candidatus Limnocylindria bacterium]